MRHNYNVKSEQHPITIRRFYGRPLKSSECSSSARFTKPACHRLEPNTRLKIKRISSAHKCDFIRKIRADTQHMKTNKVSRGSFKVFRITRRASHRLKQHNTFCAVMVRIAQSRAGHGEKWREQTDDMRRRYQIVSGERIL